MRRRHSPTFDVSKTRQDGAQPQLHAVDGWGLRSVLAPSMRSDIAEDFRSPNGKPKDFMRKAGCLHRLKRVSDRLTGTLSQPCTEGWVDGDVPGIWMGLASWWDQKHDTFLSPSGTRVERSLSGHLGTLNL